MSNLFERLYSSIDYEKGITPWDIVAASVEGNCLPWYDPRFIKGYYELLFFCFLDTAGWLKGQHYAKRVIEDMPTGIDDDLKTIATALCAGQLPQVNSWNAGNPFTCSWPAPITHYCYPWDGKMWLWAISHKAHRQLARRLKVKASGYQSPRRAIYHA
ncbi:MAG: hypothetical protein F6K04_20220 [Leptolyngbya sp. SIO4C5]|nr:hypothetical protein [Leptolyngbya sp. SIO4C5]